MHGLVFRRLAGFRRVIQPDNLWLDHHLYLSQLMVVRSLLKTPATNRQRPGCYLFQKGSHHSRQISGAAGVAPFVVVPGDDLGKRAGFLAQYLAERQVNDGAA